MWCRHTTTRSLVCWEEDGASSHTTVGSIMPRQPDVARYLVRKGAHISTASGGDLSAPMVAACNQGQVDMVTLLVKNGADVNNQNRNGKTRLDAVVRYTYNLMEGNGKQVSKAKEIFCLLLQSGANVNIQDKGGISALQLTEMKDLPEIAQLLKNPTKS